MSTLIFLANVSAFVTILTYIWLKTDAFVEYMRFFDIGFLIRRFGVEEFETAKNDDMTLEYPAFLRQKYSNSMLVKVITCSVCLSIFLSFFACILSGTIGAFPLVVFMSWVFYHGFLKLRN